MTFIKLLKHILFYFVKKEKNLYIFLISYHNQKITISHLYKKYNIVLKKLKLKNCNKIFQYTDSK